MHQIKNCVIEPMSISDHSPVVMVLDLGTEPCMKYWRINVSLLSDAKIRDEIKLIICEYFGMNDNGTVTSSILWDAGKATIRGKIISIGSWLKKDRLKKQVEVETEIKRLEREHKQHGEQEVYDKLKEYRAKLDEILTYKAEGTLRFLDRKYDELGNKASRLLSFQLQRAQASRTVPKIKQPYSNEVETSPKTISNAFAKHYEQLYKSHPQDSREEKTKDFFKNLKLAKLTVDEASALVEPITKEEIEATIVKLKNNKSPGMDGFSGECYKVFEKDLTPVLCKLYNYVLNSGNP